jgi:peptidoglycan/xylan/chitin deacetylase (PgdA/CDA1 family)
MQNVKNPSEEENGKKEATPEARKKRVKKIKTVIILTVVFFMLLPTILCILLGIRLFRLQEQVDDLVSIHITEGILSEEEKDDFAYAATPGESQASGSPEDESLPGSVVDDDDTMNPDGETFFNGAAVTGGTKDLNGSMPPGGEASPGGVASPDGSSSPDDAASPDSSSSSDGTVFPTGALSPDGATDSDGAIPSYENGDNDSLTGLNLPEDFMSDDTLSKLSPPEGITEGLEAAGQAVKNNTAQDNQEPEVKNGKYSGKNVYLTFDDGPSKYTDDILDILAEYNVKATFFVNGRTDDRSKMQYKRIVEEGHTLGMHSYSHNYKVIYKSIEDFDKDFTKLWKLLYDTTGYIPTIFRFPGGSYNKVNDHGMSEFIRYLNEKSIVYHDWNVVNGDATGEKLTGEQMLDNVLSGVAKKKTAVVLMHDTGSNKAMLDTLPQLVEELLENGARVLPIDESLKPIQQIKADSVK